MNELINIDEIGIVEFEVGKITFNAYEHIKNKALNLSENLKTVEVSEENIKESKKLIAEVNKDIKKLEDYRIKVKKEMLKPYNDFEVQVKEIVKIVKEADEYVRNQIKELEEVERENKKALVKEMFENKVKHYDFNKMITFDNFFKENMANKTTSLEKIENELSEWLEQRKMDIQIIKNLRDSEVLKEYLETFNLALAIENAKVKEEKNKKVEEVMKKTEKSSKKYIFIISEEKDAKLAEMLLKENKINYIMEEK
jgi:hypothetical protein|nr:MAG TPA: Protein of unknown function (DUF1351) [Caudoviricetes sp.]